MILPTTKRGTPKTALYCDECATQGLYTAAVYRLAEMPAAGDAAAPGAGRWQGLCEEHYYGLPVNVREQYESLVWTKAL